MGLTVCLVNIKIVVNLMRVGQNPLIVIPTSTRSSDIHPKNF
jgi:hypothetical protein